MPMSKKKTIYKPKKGKRISQKKLYKLPKQHGGGFRIISIVLSLKKSVQLNGRKKHKEMQK